MVEPQLTIIEKGSPKVLEGFRENMGPGEAKLQGISDLELKKLNVLETHFNSILNQYKAAFKEYLTELTTQQNVQSMNYKNKIVTGPQGNKYWVNNMGYSRKFTTDAWAKRDSSCPASSGSVTQQDLANFPQGPGMNPYEKCGSVGINVQSSAGGGTAWLRPWARQRHIIIMPIMMIAAQPFIIIRDLCLNENLPPFGRRACGGQWLSRCTLIMIMITVTVTPTLNLKCRYNSDSGSESESTSESLPAPL